MLHLIKPMFWQSQLTKLILSFYRENLPQLEQLRVLRYCKVSRRWGKLKIDCHDQETAEKLICISNLLQEPVSQLRLAHQINILIQGSLVGELPINTSEVNAWKL